MPKTKIEAHFSDQLTNINCESTIPLVYIFLDIKDDADKVDICIRTVNSNNLTKLKDLHFIGYHKTDKYQFPIFAESANKIDSVIKF